METQKAKASTIGDNIGLSRLQRASTRSHPHTPNDEAHSNRDEDTPDPYGGAFVRNDNAVEVSEALDGAEVASEEPVTRLYQTLLLLSGFVMCFLVFGISACYGIFQVCLLNDCGSKA